MTWARHVHLPGQRASYIQPFSSIHLQAVTAVFHHVRRPCCGAYHSQNPESCVTCVRHLGDSAHSAIITTLKNSDPNQQVQTLYVLAQFFKRNKYCTIVPAYLRHRICRICPDSLGMPHLVAEWGHFAWDIPTYRTFEIPTVAAETMRGKRKTRMSPHYDLIMNSVYNRFIFKETYRTLH